MGQAKQKYDISANKFIHKLVFQKGPFHWRRNISNCKLFWMVVWALITWPFRSLYTRRIGRLILKWGSLLVWISVHAYFYEVMWAFINDIIKEGQLIAFLNMLTENGVSTVVAWGIWIVLLVEFLVIAYTTAVMITLAIVVLPSYACSCVCDFLKKVGVFSVCRKAGNHISSYLPERAPRLHKKTRPKSQIAKKLEAIVSAVLECIDLFIEYCTARKEKICPIRTVEPID